MDNRPIRTTTENGRTLAHVPLGRKGTCECQIWEDDYKFLLRLGISGNWSRTGKNRIHVGTKASNSLLLVARVLADAKPGQRVRFRDGSPTNLKRENIELVPHGSAKKKDRDLITAGISI